MLKINVYALKDTNSLVYGNMCCGSDDKGVIKYYTDMIKSIYTEHCDSLQQKSDFLDRLEKTEIYKLGVIDLETGELTNDNNFLASYLGSNLEFELKEDYLKKKDESESDKNGE